MASPSASPERSDVTFRFGPFELDARNSELRKHGLRMRIERKPFHLLLALLEARGRLVERAELERLLWPGGLFVDFEHGLNVAVQKVRQALNDSAEEPRYIETIAREGYRFIGSFERIAALAAPPDNPMELRTPAEVQPSELPQTSATEVAGRRRFVWPAAAVAAVLAAATLSFLWWRSAHSVLFKEPGWVLISDFDNRTGQPVLDGTLEYALERDLSNSQFVRVAPRPRIDDTLRLMKKPLNTRLDRALGREVCLRDGEIKALITGRIEKLGTIYVLSANIVNPATGVTVTSFTEEDQHDDQLAAAVRRLSGRVRKSLGEDPELVQQSLEKLEKVTTPSLRALQLYTQADRVVARTAQGNAQAAELLEQALREDPGFVSAHLLLGYAYLNRGRWEQGYPHFQRAFDLAATVPERERLFILGSYYGDVLLQHDKSINAYETLLRLYPDHYWGWNNIIAQYRRARRSDEADAAVIRRAELRPQDLSLAINTVDQLTMPFWWTADLDQRKFERAQSYGARALKLWNSQRDTAAPRDEAQLWLALCFQSWLAGQPDQAYAQFNLGLRRHVPGDGLDIAFAATAIFFGKLRQAEDIANTMSNDPVMQAAVAFFRGDVLTAKQALVRFSDQDVGREDLAAALMVHIGMLREAEGLDRKLIAVQSFDLKKFPDQKEKIVNEAGGRTNEGELALAKGSLARGIGILERNLQYRPAATSTALAYESLADAYRKQHRLADALRALQQAPDKISAGPTFFSRSYYLRVRLKLADVYREMGRISDAEKVEAELRKQLVIADPDHPILLALQQREHATREAARK